MIMDEEPYEPDRVIERETRPIPASVQLLMSLLPIRERVRAQVGSLPLPVDGSPPQRHDNYLMADEALQTAAYWLEQAASAEPKE
jgi:hypothetical protein